MYAFDLLYLSGSDLRGVPLNITKDRLRDLVRKTDILFSDSFDTDGAAIFESLRNGHRLEAQGKPVSVASIERLDQGHVRQRETLVIAEYTLKENRFDRLWAAKLVMRSNIRKRSTVASNMIRSPNCSLKVQKA